MTKISKAHLWKRCYSPSPPLTSVACCLQTLDVRLLLSWGCYSRDSGHITWQLQPTLADAITIFIFTVGTAHRSFQTWHFPLCWTEVVRILPCQRPVAGGSSGRCGLLITYWFASLLISPAAACGHFVDDEYDTSLANEVSHGSWPGIISSCCRWDICWGCVVWYMVKGTMTSPNERGTTSPRLTSVAKRVRETHLGLGCCLAGPVWPFYVQTGVRHSGKS